MFERIKHYFDKKKVQKAMAFEKGQLVRITNAKTGEIFTGRLISYSPKWIRIKKTLTFDAENVIMETKGKIQGEEEELL